MTPDAVGSWSDIGCQTADIMINYTNYTDLAYMTNTQILSKVKVKTHNFRDDLYIIYWRNTYFFIKV